jgi:hypothetical protein
MLIYRSNFANTNSPATSKTWNDKNASLFLSRKMEAYKNKVTYLIEVNVTNTFQHEKRKRIQSK